MRHWCHYPEITGCIFSVLEKIFSKPPQQLKINLKDNLYVLSPPKCHLLLPTVIFYIVVYCGIVFTWLWYFPWLVLSNILLRISLLKLMSHFSSQQLIVFSVDGCQEFIMFTWWCKVIIIFSREQLYVMIFAPVWPNLHIFHCKLYQ